MILYAWLQRWREAGEMADYRDGYNIAAGALLRGEDKTVLALAAKPPRNAFERGVCAAAEAWSVVVNAVPSEGTK